MSWHCHFKAIPLYDLRVDIGPPPPHLEFHFRTLCDTVKNWKLLPTINYSFLENELFIFYLFFLLITWLNFTPQWSGCVQYRHKSNQSHWSGTGQSPDIPHFPSFRERQSPDIPHLPSFREKTHSSSFIFTTFQEWQSPNNLHFPQFKRRQSPDNQYFLQSKRRQSLDNQYFPQSKRRRSPDNQYLPHSEKDSVQIININRIPRKTESR